MIYARPNQEFEATLQGGAAGLDPTVSIVDGPTQRTLVDPTTDGVVEFPAKVYTATLTAPNEGGAFLVVWNDGTNVAVEELVVSEVGAPVPPATASYATPTDVRDFTLNADLIALDDDELLKRIIAAEPDVDRAVGFYAVRDNGRRFDPLTMTQRDGRALARATAAQVEYRFVMGEDFFTRDQHASVNGPEFSVQGRLARIGPKVYEELQSGRLLALSTSWKGVGDSPPWASFSHNLD